MKLSRILRKVDTITFFLFTSDITRARKEIEDLGGQVATQTSASTIHAIFQEEPDLSVLQFSSRVMSGNMNEEDEIAFQAWNMLCDKAERQAKSPPDDLEGLPWDAPGFKAP